MKKLIRLSRIDVSDEDEAAVGPVVLRDLFTIYPDGDHGTWFGCTLPEGDFRMKAILDRLRIAGFRPWINHFRKRDPTEFGYDWLRVYEPGDFDAAAYFEMNPSYSFEGFTRNGDGLLELNPRKMGNKVDVAIADGFRRLVSKRLKAIIESNSLTHVKFLRTVVPERGAVKADVQSPARRQEFTEMWEITSDLILPPLSPTCTLFDNDGNRFSGDYSNGCIFKDEIYTTPQLRYLKSAIARVEPFDCGLSFERGGIKPGPDDRDRVFSRRFYNLCKEAGIAAEWVPVVIEEG